MRARVERRLSGFSRRQLFTVAADFRAYPRFLPFCRAMRVLERLERDTEGRKRLRVDNVFGFPGARVRFVSEATFDPPAALDIVSTDGPFERLDIAWRFVAAGDGECDVAFEIATEFRAGVLTGFTALFADTLMRKTIDAFVAEARRRGRQQASGNRPFTGAWNG